MKKLFIIGIVSLFLISLVFAGDIILDNTVIIEKPIIKEPILSPSKIEIIKDSVLSADLKSDFEELKGLSDTDIKAIIQVKLIEDYGSLELYDVDIGKRNYDLLKVNK